MAIKSPPQFQRPEGRAEFERCRNAARALLSDAPPEESLRAIQGLAQELDLGVSRVKAHLLGSALCWTPNDRALSAWIYDQHCEFAELARRGADIFERRLGSDNPATMKLVAIAFLHWGEAAKWIVGRRERYDYSWLHWLMRVALQAHRHVEPFEVKLDGRARSVSIEALYFRTLVLDRFAGGNLTRPQVEVLDAWLWEWSDALRGETLEPAGPAWRADLDGKAGLRQGLRHDGGPCLYLPIAPLEARRDAVIREFHHGRIVPSVGVASDFRVEEHVAVLEQLRAAFQASHADDEQRTTRQPTPRSYVEAWVGPAEILSRGLKGAGVGATRLALAPKNASVNMDHRVRNVQFADEGEASRRELRLVNASDTGYGFEASEKDASGIAIGDLVGLRISEAEPCVLGRVVRRGPGHAEGEVVIGVQTITRAPRSVTLARTNPQNRPDDEDVFIYVAGADASGASDSFLVPEKIVIDGESRDARIGDDIFTLRFNRVRRRGRGWSLAGFEIVDAKRVRPQEPAPSHPLLMDIVPRAHAPKQFDPARTGTYPRFETADDDDPFKNEVGMRLL